MTQPMPSAPRERALCSGCGAISHPGGEPCGMCGANPSAAPPAALIDTEAAYWVAVKCEFKCRVCRHDAPLNYFDADGSVQCVGCGTEQKFVLNQWRVLVEHAHAVGDLAGRPPEAIGLLPGQNPFGSIGVAHQCMELEIEASDGDDLDLKIKASPGNPLSQEDHVPLHLAACNGLEVSLRHPRTGVTTNYEMPNNARQLGVKGVIARQHVTGGAMAKVAGGPGGLALSCPTCSAPLEVSEVGTLVTCKFCSASVMVPVAALRGLGHTRIPADVWWMLFEGPSKKRKELLREREVSERRAESKKQLSEKRAEPSRQRARSKEAGSRPAGRKKPVSPALVLLCMVGGLAVLGLLAWGTLMQPLRSKSQDQPPAAPPPAIPTRAAPTQAPEPPAFEVVWKGSVLSAEGKKLKKGTPCELRARTNLDKVQGFLVRCGNETLYDSSVPVGMGIANYKSEVTELPADPSGKARYGLDYQDIGQRTGRAQARVSTSQAQAVVEQPNLPSYKVTLKVGTSGAPVDP